MSDTTMYAKGLDDGWFLIASAADNVSIKSNSDGFWHVAVADTLPAAGFVGEKHSGIGVKQITGLSGNVYLRAVSTHSFAVTVGTLQQGVTYGLDDSGALVAQEMVGGAAKVSSNTTNLPENLYEAATIQTSGALDNDASAGINMVGFEAITFDTTAGEVTAQQSIDGAAWPAATVDVAFIDMGSATRALVTTTTGGVGPFLLECPFSSIRFLNDGAAQATISYARVGKTPMIAR